MPSHLFHSSHTHTHYIYIYIHVTASISYQVPKSMHTLLLAYSAHTHKCISSIYLYLFFLTFSLSASTVKGVDKFKSQLLKYTCDIICTRAMSDRGRLDNGEMVEYRKYTSRIINLKDKITKKTWLRNNTYFHEDPLSSPSISIALPYR